MAEHFRPSHRGERLDPGIAYGCPPLRELGDRPARLLSGGEQQLLAVGWALARRPTPLRLDEVSLGPAPVIVERLLPIVRQHAIENGCAVLLVEQHVHLAHVKITAKEGEEETVWDGLQRLAAPARAVDGREIFEVHREVEDPRRFSIYEKARPRHAPCARGRRPLARHRQGGRHRSLRADGVHRAEGGLDRP